MGGAARQQRFHRANEFVPAVEGIASYASWQTLGPQGFRISIKIDESLLILTCLPAYHCYLTVVAVTSCLLWSQRVSAMALHGVFISGCFISKKRYIKCSLR